MRGPPSPSQPRPPADDAQAQRVQLDEAFGVALVVGAGVVLEGNDLVRIERLWRLAADDRGQALVELEAYGAGHVLLTVVDRRLQHLALGREPESVVNELCVARHQLVLEVHGALAERDLLDAAMR